MRTTDRPSLEALTLSWIHRTQGANCDVSQRWEHGRILRATRFPRYYDLNVVLVEDDPKMSVPELVSLADQALDGLEHRRVDFDSADAAEPLRADFEALGWKATRLLWMYHHGPRTDGGEGVSTPAVAEVSYDDADPLRAAWHREDYPGPEDPDFLAQRREISMRRGVRVIAAHHDGIPVAFAQLECEEEAGEITSVYVLGAHRGAGLGTAVTRAAIAAAGGVPRLWICADDEDRPKRLYARLGFVPVLRTFEFTRLP